MRKPDVGKTCPLPEKARLLERLKAGRFDVPDFIYVPADDFEKKNFDSLNAFLENHRESFKVIARSAHPKEEFFKGGTFDSVETYADIGGVEYARKKMLQLAGTAKQLSIKRQQIFHNAPVIVPDEMGIIVMPFIEGSSVMAKMIGNNWEFGYCRDRVHKLQSEPYITNTPHDTRLLQLSEDIQNHLEFQCEIEYIISSDGEIHVVQAKDISNIETLELKESERSVRLDGIRRIRKRRNYRERLIYVMDTRAFYLDVISKCEDMVHECTGPRPGIEDVIAVVESYEAELEAFAMRHQRFGVLGLAIENPDDLYQVANHYLDEIPELQALLSKRLHANLYRIDNFLSEADTLIAKDKFRVNLCSHDAYGIDTVRNPMWNVYWSLDRHEEVVAEFVSLGFKTEDTIGIDINEDEKPTVFRL
jgi:hypothetical protein